MMVDPSYIRLRAERTGAIGVDIETDIQTNIQTIVDPSGPDVSGHRDSSAPNSPTLNSSTPVRLRITRILPTKDAPGFARSLLGDSLTIVETQEWPPVVAGEVDATMEAAFGSLVRLSGAIHLADQGRGSVAETKVDCRASVPLVGGKVEELVEKQVRDYLAYEVKVAAEWLADCGN